MLNILQIDGESDNAAEIPAEMSNFLSQWVVGADCYSIVMAETEYGRQVAASDTDLCVVFPQPPHHSLFAC